MLIKKENLNVDRYPRDSGHCVQWEQRMNRGEADGEPMEVSKLMEGVWSVFSSEG